MRSSKSRSRSKANRPHTLGNIVNRVFDSSGPDGKVRGTPAQIIEKYQFLARDAQLSNDRVGAETFLQHAEHYTRMLAEAMREMQAEQDARQQYSPPVQGGNVHSGNPGSYSGGNQSNTSDGNQNGNAGGNSGGNQNGNRNSNQNVNREGNQSGNRDGNPGGQRNSNPGGQRENRYEPRRDDRAADAPSGLGPVIGADDDEGGPVATPEAAIAEPRFDRSRNDAPRQDRNDAPRQDRNDAPRQDRNDAPRQDRSDAPRQDRNDAPRQDRNDAPRQDRSDAPRQDREPRPVQAAAQPVAAQSAPRASEPAPSEGNPPRRAPRPYPPRARVATEDQPVLPSFITGAPEPALAPPEAAEKPKAALRPRKSAAPKVVAEAVDAGEPKSGE